jgi:hypothetical protein
LNGVDVVPEHVARRQVAVEEDEARHHHGKKRRRPHPDATGVPRHALTDPTPQAVGLVRAHGADPRDERPECPAPEHRQQGGQEGQHRDHRHRDAHRPDRSKPRGSSDLGQRKGEKRRDHGPAGGEDDRACPPQGHANGAVLVVMPAQLLAVAGDHQQGVIRPGAEDQHRQNAPGLTGDRHPSVGDQIAESSRGHLGEEHSEERDDPEDRAAIDEDQKQQHKTGGREQQGPVDVVEDLDRVSGETCGAGHLRLEPVRQRGEFFLDLLGRIREQVLRITARLLRDRDRGGQQRGGAVAGDLGRTGLGDGLGTLGVDRRAHSRIDRRSNLPDRSRVPGVQPAVTVKDRDRVGLIVGGKAVQAFNRLDRLRVRGEIVGGVVLLSILELARQRPNRDQDDDPDRDDRKLGATAARKLGEFAGR